MWRVVWDYVSLDLAFMPALMLIAYALVASQVGYSLSAFVAAGSAALIYSLPRLISYKIWCIRWEAMNERA